MDFIGEMQEYYRAKREQMANLMNMVFHRIEYGSPILLKPADDLGIPPDLSNDFRLQSIKLRRKLLGLPYKEWEK